MVITTNFRVNRMVRMERDTCNYAGEEGVKAKVDVVMVGLLNSVALVSKRTILSERPPLVGEVSANFCGYRVLRGQRNEFPRPLISVF
jgi:hypothetical protein